MADRFQYNVTIARKMGISRGIIDLLAWAVGQTGTWGQGYPALLRVRFRRGLSTGDSSLSEALGGGAYTMGSGDNNPNDHTLGPFFQILPTARLFAKFPFYDTENSRDIMGIVILRPGKIVTISSEFHTLALANNNGLWYTGSGAFQPWTLGFTGRAIGGGRSLANLYDTSLGFRLSRDVTARVYAGYAPGRAAIATVYPQGHNGG
jgi:hypothetical protein